MNRAKRVVLSVAYTWLALIPQPAWAFAHLWQISEVFTNHDGTVQFVELFNGHSSEQYTAGTILRANSDGVIKDFTIPADLPFPPSTENRYMLIATPGFGSLIGGVTSNYSLPDPTTDGPFFNANATNITISYLASGDALSFSGALLPKDGFNSLTDTNAVTSGNPPSISITANSPTNFENLSGSVNVPPPQPTGDYNGDELVNAADYTVWRDRFGESVPAGTSADGSGPSGTPDGVIDDLDYQFWKDRYGNVVASVGVSRSSTTHAIDVPEPFTATLFLIGLWLNSHSWLSQRARHAAVVARIRRITSHTRDFVKRVIRSFIVSS